MGTQSPMNYNQPPSQQEIYRSLILGPQSSTVTCPSCHAQVKTRVEIEASTKTHLIALLLCLICLPCVFIPYCNDSCQSKNHYCTNCAAYLGRYEG